MNYHARSIGQMVPANAPITSQLAARKARRGQQTSKAEVMACFAHKETEDVGKPWYEHGMCDLELQFRCHCENSDKRSRRQELDIDDRKIVPMNVIVLVMRNGGEHAYIKHRLRRPDDPFDVPMPELNDPKKPRRRTHDEALVGDTGLELTFETEATLKVFLKKYRYLPRPDENGQRVFGKRKSEIILRYTPGPGTIRAQLSLEPRPVFTGKIIYIRETEEAMRARCGAPLQMPPFAGGHAAEPTLTAALSQAADATDPGRVTRMPRPARRPGFDLQQHLARKTKAKKQARRQDRLKIPETTPA